MKRESSRARFSIRYAQCWEDADILLKALDIQPDHTCLSIASAGDNTLAIVSRGPKRVIAVDMNPAQIACLELRVAAYRELNHRELLELIGSIRSSRREDLYRRCRSFLSPSSRGFWDSQPSEIQKGIGQAGRFEKYLTLFRSRILPLVHPGYRIERLLQNGTPQERREFYRREWDTWRWRVFFHLYFSRFAMARIGRDQTSFRYATGSVSKRLLEKTHRALTDLDPFDNPYLQWILTGLHMTALPHALRPENFEAIRRYLDRLEWHCCSIEEFLERLGEAEIDRCNLSDIFEYMTENDYHRVLERLARAGKRSARLAYWNMLVERLRPPHLKEKLRPLAELSRELHEREKAFFYSAFVLEEVL